MLLGMKRRNWKGIFDYILLTVVLMAVPLLYLIPTETIYHGHTICVFKNLFGIECWGCGMTRAVFSLLYLDLEAAWGFNKMVFIVVPLMLWLYVKLVLRLWRKLYRV